MLSIFDVKFWKDLYNNINYIIYLFFYTILYPIPKRKENGRSTNWGGTSYHNYGGDGGGSNPSQGDNNDNRRGGMNDINRYRNVRRIPMMGG